MESSTGRVVISDEALDVAIDFARTKKAEHIAEARDGGDPAHYELAADWRDEERMLLYAIGGVGLRPTGPRNPLAE